MAVVQSGAEPGQRELVHELNKELSVVRHLVDALHCSVPPRPDLLRLMSDLVREVTVLDDLLVCAGPSAGVSRSPAPKPRTGAGQPLLPGQTT